MIGIVVFAQCIDLAAGVKCNELQLVLDRESWCSRWIFSLEDSHPAVSISLRVTYIIRENRLDANPFTLL